MRDKGGGWGTTGGNKQGIGTWGGGEEVQQWEAPEQTPEPLRGWDQELGRESEGHSLTLRSLGKTSEGTCHPPAPDTTQGAEGERNVLGNACVGLWPLEEPGLEVGMKQGQPFIFELLKLVAYINLTKKKKSTENIKSQNTSVTCSYTRKLPGVHSPRNYAPT